MRYSFIIVLFTFTFNQNALGQHHSSFFSQGLKYYSGDGVRQDYGRAHDFFQRAANHGHGRSQFYLGEIHHRGYGRNPNFDQARYWYERAVKKNILGAHHQLGRFYENGLGVDRDYSQAAYWYIRSIDNGYHDSVDPLAQLYLNGHISTSAIVNSTALTKDNAESGDISAQYNLGYMHYIGHNVPKDLTLAANWFLRAASQGDGDSQFNLGRMYRLGKGVKADAERCYIWSSLATKNGHEESLQNKMACQKGLSKESIERANNEITSLVSTFSQG